MKKIQIPKATTHQNFIHSMKIYIGALLEQHYLSTYTVGLWSISTRYYKSRVSHSYHIIMIEPLHALDSRVNKFPLRVFPSK